MADIISLLPENVANQIAAGEVVQRPASVVKELLENAIDAGAKSIKLIIKDAGKTLIQVIDNGKGMSETDARMCFERHATSKIKTSEDIFKINTKGFRGEALAAISAVAQVELKTRLEANTTGTLIEIEGNNVVKQEVCAHPAGTSISVKNLFYNVPARRNFLKEDKVELKHIIDEFVRVAMPHPEIAFNFFSNGNELYQLPASALMARIVGLFGNSFSNKLVWVEEDTPYLKIKGYVCRPDAAKKKGAEQHFYINNRFIKNAYIRHAVCSAYDELIQEAAQPQFFLFLELPPNSIDINIHPSKTEIKFEDDKTVYALLRTAVKRALGKNNLAPSLDFEVEQSMEFTYGSGKTITPPEVKYNKDYNPFNSSSSYQKPKDSHLTAINKNNTENWQSLYKDYVNNDEQQFQMEKEVSQEKMFENPAHVEFSDSTSFLQLQNKYILVQSDAGLLLVDQQRAHETILYNHYKEAITSSAIAMQQELFPNTLELSPADYNLLNDLKPALSLLGFDVEALGGNTCVIHAIPADLVGQNSAQVIEGVLENYKLNNLEIKLDGKENLCRSMAKHNSIKAGKGLEKNEMKLLLEHLFKLENYTYTPNGRNIFTEIAMEDIDKLFKRK